MASHEVPFVQALESRLRDLESDVQDIKAQHGVSSLYDCKSEVEYGKLHKKLQNLFADATETNGDTSISDDETGSSATVGPSTFHQTSLEAAARNLLYSLISEHNIDSPEFDGVWNLLDLLIMCTSPTGPDGTGAAICDPSLPLWLIEELFDSQTIVGCRRIFDYLESSWHFLLHASGTHKETGISNNTKMILLRSCNELLRRLSRAEDAVFCGRIFMFLFGSFPLGDKSSVNLRGDFHTENTTTFDDVSRLRDDQSEHDAAVNRDENMEEEGKDEGQEGQDAVNGETVQAQDGEAAAQDKMEVDPDPKQESKAETTNGDRSDKQKSTDDKKHEETTSESAVASEAKSSEEAKDLDTDAFYTAFWSLQHVFSNPTKLFEQEEFHKFQKGMELTIEKFKTTPKVLQTHGTPRTPSEGKRGIKRRRSKMEDDFASNFNPKYLTSRELFELELSDMTFQRHILVQALILIDFLLSLTPKAKKKLAELKAQRAMLYNFTLSEDDTKWAASIRAKIASYLQEGVDGKFYYRMADTVLARDKNWVRWKVESCPPIEKSPMPTKDVLEARAGARRACTARRLKTNLDGAVDIDFLSDVENVNHLGTLKDTGRVSAQEEHKYLQDIDTVDLDLEMATEEEKPYLLETRASATWRTLRLVSKHRLNMFDRIDEAGGLKTLIELDLPQELELVELPNENNESTTAEALEQPEGSQEPSISQYPGEPENNIDLQKDEDLQEPTAPQAMQESGALEDQEVEPPTDLEVFTAIEPSGEGDVVFTNAATEDDAEGIVSEQQIVEDISTEPTEGGKSPKNDTIIAADVIQEDEPAVS